MARITKAEQPERKTLNVKTRTNTDQKSTSYTWWRAKSKKEMAQQVVETAAYLKTQQQYRQRQSGIFARLYGNIPLSSFVGQASAIKAQTMQTLPIDRPTMNVVQSCVDTLVSRISQARPRPLFLTDNGDYKQRKLGKQLNNFIAGEFYQTDVYELAQEVLRDACAMGTGCIYIYEKDEKIAIERVLATELYVDENDAFYGKPRSLYRLKLIDRSVVADMIPEEASKIAQAEQAYVESGSSAADTVSNMIMLVEAWHLPSGKDAKDGKHVVACTSGLLLEEDYKDQDFPFEFIHFSPRLVGFWGQGLSEQLMGTQVEINKLLSTISQSISLVGVPRVFVEDGSKVVKAHLNNNIGSIVTYRGTKPQYEVAPCVPQELYAQLQRLIDYAYQQSGVSALSATSQKPAGLNSGEAIRNYDDLQSDRFAVINKRYNNMFIGLAQKMIKKAVLIAEKTGKYETIYPNKDGSKQIDLPKISKINDPFVIQCYDSSSLPRDPAGRLQKVTEMMQAGIIDPSEGRRLLDFPDLAQVDKLANAARERIYKMLDEIVEEGSYESPDPYIDIQLGLKIVTEYYNLYAASNLEEDRLEMLRTFQSQLKTLQQEMMGPAQPMQPAEAQTQAVPEQSPVSDLLSQVPQTA